MNQTQPEPTHQFEQRPDQAQPGGFWIRFIANLIDGLVVGVITVPVNFVIGLLSGQQGTAESFGIMGFNYLFNWLIVGVFAGYFYSQKGATPGKLVFNLYVRDADTGSNISFWKGFFRDSVGKTISALVFFIGYIMAAFRKDKAALHDLMLNTRVWKK
ncbi:MAG: RDD family protein [Oligoflexus sp.]